MSVQELARKHAPEDIKTFAGIAKKGTPGARVSAAIALFDRHRSSTLTTGSFKRAVEMTDDELAAIAARALTLVKGSLAVSYFQISH